MAGISCEDAIRPTVGATLPVVVDYFRSLQEMVAAGGYSHVSPKVVEENFPVGSGDAGVQAVLVRLGETAPTDQVLERLGRYDLLPATMPQRLAFDAQHADQQRRFPTAALGSVWTRPDDSRLVSLTWECPGHRDLQLIGYDHDWGGLYRFLAIRRETFPLTIDYSWSLARMVRAGYYDDVDPGITAQHFPVKPGESKVLAVVVHLNYGADTEEVLEELERRGLRPATMPELLGFIEQHAERCRKFPIMALGSIWTDADSGNRAAGGVFETPHVRELYLNYSRWGAGCRFLAICK